MYSSRTKNWFHTHPLLTLWTPIMPCFLCAIMFLCCSFPILLWDEEWRGETKLLSKRHQRNSSRQFPMSIGTTFRCKDGYRWLLWWRQRSNESNMKNSAKPQRNGTTNIHGIPGALEILVNHLQEKRSNGTLNQWDYEDLQRCLGIMLACIKSRKQHHCLLCFHLCSVNLCLFSYNVISLEGLYKCWANWLTQVRLAHLALGGLRNKHVKKTARTREFGKSWTTVGRPPGKWWMCNSVLIFSALVLKMRWSHLNRRVVFDLATQMVCHRKQKPVQMLRVTNQTIFLLIIL